MNTSKRNVLGMGLICLVAILGLVAYGCKKKTEDVPPPETTLAETTPAETKPAETTPAEAKPAEGALGKYKYVMEVVGVAGNTSKMRFEYLVDNKRFSMKMSTKEGEAQKLTAYFVSNGTDLFMLQPESKLAMKMPLKEGQGPEGISKDLLIVPDWTKFEADNKDKGFTKKGQADVNGAKCVQYEAEVAGAGKVTYSVDDKNLIRRIQALGADGKEVYTMDVLEVDMNPTVTDADFAVPDGYQIHDMTQMMKNAGAPAAAPAAGATAPAAPAEGKPTGEKPAEEAPKPNP